MFKSKEFSTCSLLLEEEKLVDIAWQHGVISLKWNAKIIARWLLFGGRGCSRSKYLQEFWRWQYQIGYKM
jgi:hypothetical protein